MKVNVLGDSHSLVFNHSTDPRFEFNVCRVDGATARGSINPNTRTNSLNIFRDFLENNKGDKLFIMLGEVDCGYLIWYKHKFEGLNVNDQMIDSIDRLFQFIQDVALKYYNIADIVVLGSNPPTIEDNADPRFLVGARAYVNTPLQDRLNLTRDYNKELQNRCDTIGCQFISILESVIDSTTDRIKDIWRNENPHDHHLNNKTISIWINEIKKLDGFNIMNRLQISQFYGLRRSGNHAILEWMLHSMGLGHERQVLKPMRIITRGIAAYFNEANTSPNQAQLLYDLTKSQLSGINYAIIAYEDVNLDYVLTPFTERKIVIIRDIPTLAASRIKRGTVDMKVNQEFVNKWQEYARAFQDPNYLTIKFEDWLTDKRVRDQFMARLGYQNLDKTDTVTEFGNGSSFNGQKLDTPENLLNRHKQVEFTPEVLELINQPQVLELRQQLGYI